MPEVLRVEVGDEVRRLGAPDPVLDPAVAAIVEAAAAEAEARGRREGELAGRQAAEAVARRGVEAVLEALRAVHDELRAQRQAACGASLEVAEHLAREVVGRTPPDDATVVLERVRQAVAVLDDETLELHAHPDDVDALADHLGDGGLRLVPDRSLAPGDTRLTGAWGGADLTRTALLEAALAAVGQEPR